MWIFSAGEGAVFVNSAGVVGQQIEARRGFKDVIVVFIESQILRYQLAFFHAQSFGHAAYVGLSKDGAGGFATIGAAQAVALGEFFFVGVVEALVQIFGFGFIPFPKDKLIGLEVGFGQGQYFFVFVRELLHVCFNFARRYNQNGISAVQKTREWQVAL
jgi:hypothetical protein